MSSDSCEKCFQKGQTCAERKEEGPHAAEWHVKEDSDEASWNDGVEVEEEGLDLCIPKIWLS